MNAFRTVIRHEIKRLLKDRKALLSLVLMPVISGMIVLATSLFTSDSQDYTIWFAGCAVEETTVDAGAGMTLSVKNAGTDAESFLRSGSFKKTDVLVDLERGEITYNSASGAGNSLLYMAVDMIEESYRESFYAMIGAPEHTVICTDTSGETDVSTIAMAIFLPYMLILLIFNNVTSYTCDSIAGEKERGCFEKTLLTPTDPSSIILGKTCSGILLGLASTLLYVISVALFSSLSGSTSLINFSSLSVHGIVLIALCAVIVAYLFSTLLVLCSLFAKTTKEARTNALPLMAVSILPALFSMLRAGTVSLKMYLIPIYNICILIQDILKGQIEIVKMAAATVSLFACALAAFIISCRVFNSESIRC